MGGSFGPRQVVGRLLRPVVFVQEESHGLCGYAVTLDGLWLLRFQLPV